jgi:hypothetical protein
MIKLRFYVPRGDQDRAEAKEIEELLEQAKDALNIDYEIHTIDRDGEEELKRNELWVLSVFNQIKIKQTGKTKSLYPQLIISVNGKPVTFYPQERKGRKGIIIKEFLEGLLGGEVKCLHDKSEIEDELNELQK